MYGGVGMLFTMSRPRQIRNMWCMSYTVYGSMCQTAGVVNSPPESGNLKASHTDTLFFIGKDY